MERELAPADDTLIAPAVGWMLAGIPRMRPGLEQSLTGRIRLVLTEQAGGGESDICRDGDDIVVGVPRGDPAVTVTSDAHAFVLWGTAREPWQAMPAPWTVTCRSPPPSSTH